MIWEITESEDEMYALLNRDYPGKVSAQAKRTAHHLAGSAAMRSMMPDPTQMLVKDEYGKPHTEDGRYHLSVSHSGDYAVAVGSQEHPVGVDIEHLGDRILRIESKFVRDDERELLHPDHLRGLYLIWSAKEAMYKLYGRKALDFKENMRVLPRQLGDSGTVTGLITKDHIRWEIDLNYEFWNGYSLVWTAGAHREIID